MFLNSLFSWKCNKLVAQSVNFLGAISSFKKNPNEPTKSSLTVIAQSGHPKNTPYCLFKEILRCIYTDEICTEWAATGKKMYSKFS